MVNEKLVSKKLVAILLAVVLVIGTLPVGFASVFAAIKNKYVISIADYNYSGTVTLTDKNNAENKFTQEMKKGEAKFDNLDDETAYDLKITKLYGFGDYHNDNFVPSDTSFTLSNTDLTAVNTVKVSGRIVDESDKPVENLGFTYSPVGFTDISFDGNTDDNGKYSFDVYKDVEYSVEFNVDKQYNEVKKTVNASHDENFGDEKLSLKQFGISAKVTAAGGKITGDNTMVDYGKDLQKDTIVAKADTNYVIKTLTVDGNEIDDAKGLEIYDLSKVDALKNVTENHSVSVSFYRPTYEITINYNKNGTVKDNSDNHLVTSGGKIILKQGDVAGFTAVAETNYHIAKVKIDGKSVDDVDFNNATTKYSKTFDDNKAHSVTITFAINTFNVTVNSGENGTATASPATVDYNGSTDITITPDKGYDIEIVKVNGLVVDNLTETENGYKYTISDIKADVTVEVKFDKINSSIPADIISNKYYKITFSSAPVNEYVAKNGTNVFVLKKDAIATISGGTEYSKVQINSSILWGYSTSKQINSTVKINSIASSKGKGASNKHISQLNVLIAIDKDAPTITVEPMNWTNSDSYTVTGTVSDKNTADNPSSGIEKVVYGTEVGYANATNEATLNADKTKYSFEISNEENKTYYIYAVDKSNNVSKVKTFESKIDRTAPTIDEFKFEAISLNACTHGTYASDAITVTITASDSGNVQSGAKEITFNGETRSVIDGKAEFKITSADKTPVSATVTDNAGNVSEITYPTSVKSNVKSDSVTISNETPSATITIADNKKENLKRYDAENGIVWFNGDADFKVDLNDKNGIKYIEVILNGKKTDTVKDSDNNDLKISEKKGENDIDIDFSETKETKKTIYINTALKTKTGQNKLEVKVTNVSGKSNDTSINDKLYIDTTKPQIKKFEFNKSESFKDKLLHILTFGTYSNTTVEVSVTAEDKNASAGVKSITLYGKDATNASAEYEILGTENKKIVKNTDGTYTATFTLPKDVVETEKGKTYLDVLLAAKAVDNVENETEKFAPATTGNSNIKTEKLMIETVAPEASITCPTPAQDKNSATGDSNDWYPGDVDLKIDICDPEDNGTCSGIASILLSQKVGDKFETITVDAKGNEIKQTYTDTNTDTKTDKISLTLNTSTLKANSDGSYTIKVDATDNAGNDMSSVTKTIYKDSSTPSVTDFKFTAKGYAFDKSVESANTAPVEETSYGYYFIKDTEVTVTANDEKPSSGVKSITYYTVDKDGVKSEVKTEPVNKDNQITFTVKANFKGQIYAKACDNVGHTPDTFSKPNGAVIESPDLHTQTSAIKYTLKDSKDANGADIKDENGNNLYGADTTVDVEIADTYSGIRQIDWEIVSPFDDKKQAGTVTVDNNGKVTSVAKKGYSDDCLGDWVATGEANTNLIVNLKNTIKVSNDSNNIQIKFTLTDRAGNVTKNVVQTLSIDKTAPKIAVQMNENDDKEFNGYFKGSREADIYVYERNFSQSDVVFDVKRTDDNNKQTNVSPKPKFKYVGTQVIDGRECFVYKMTTKFTADGDYNFKVSASDITSHIANAESVNYKSDNKNVKFSSDKTAEYTAQNDADRAIDIAFTVDNTKPVVSVSYDNNTATNDKYFNAYRTATITVVEHNFSTAASRIIYKRTSAKDGSNIAEPTVSSWSRKGNTYTATIKYNADGDYTFDMQVIDKAGNKDKGVKFSGTAAKDFTVDTTIAKPSIKGVENGKSYKGSVLPSISFNDINIANSEIKLLRTRKNEINKDVTSDFIKISKNAKGGSFTANEETFKKLQENDGIYTLSVNISDKAGNKSSQTVKFTVNRFGSVYALNKYLVNDLNNSYVQSIDNNLVITEYNPDKLVKGTLEVVVTRDGSPVEFGDGQLTVNPVVNSTVQIGQSGWYQYNYTISKDLFTDDNGKAIDGIYKIYIASEDEVGNKSENINYKDADVIFRLDTTAPSLKSVSGLEKSVVNATKLDVSYEIFDSIGIKSIDVYYVNENGIDSVDRIRSKDSKEENAAGYIEDVTSYNGKFTIGECSKENVRFVITDLAGNVTDTGDSNNKAVNFDSSSLEFNSTITVSTNPFTRWYAHTVLFWCSIAAIAVAIGACGFAVATKLRKREEKATEDYKNSKKNK